MSCHVLFVHIFVCNLAAPCEIYPDLHTLSLRDALPICVGENYKTDMAITDSVIHELDVLRWLLADDYVSVQVVFPRKTSQALAHLRDPQIVLLETARGTRIDVEVFVNCQYG